MHTVFEVPGSIVLSKAAGADEWIVGGIASGFLRDLDGDAIAPDAVSRAIPGFMAKRGTVVGGPLRLHHGFWDHFLRQAIDSLFLPGDEKKSLVAAIALPLGRVTKIWVDDQGRTHWRGVLSKVNPIARIVWQMLREGAVHLGVSLGGKILSTRPGVDARGKVCQVIDAIRLDEISITDNPAYRITEGEDSGAYIAALAKSAQKVLMPQTPMKRTTQVDRFLRKALSSPSTADKQKKRVDRFLKKAIAADGGSTVTGIGKDTIGNPKFKGPGGGANVGMDGKTITTGMAKDNLNPSLSQPKGGAQIPTDVWGMTMRQFTRELSKASSCG
ncbi:MAG TPA: hypothetical protein V6C46_04505, partial [Coleofasciculaceae cyanobacterium]